MGDQFGKEVDEPIHLRATGDGTAQSMIRLSAIFLLPSLRRPRLPVVGHRLGGVLGDVLRDVICIHAANLSGSSFIIQWPTFFILVRVTSQIPLRHSFDLEALDRPYKTPAKLWFGSGVIHFL